MTFIAQRIVNHLLSLVMQRENVEVIVTASTINTVTRTTSVIASTLSIGHGRLLLRIMDTTCVLKTGRGENYAYLHESWGKKKRN